MSFKADSKVTWDWGSGKASGKILEVYKETVTKSLKGDEVTRHGDKENPAYLIEQDDGDQVLKLHSEVSSDE